MKPVQVSGEVDSVGKLHLNNIPLLPVSQKVRVLILEQTDIAAIEQMIELSEEVWFFVNGDKDKCWFYLGRVKAFRTVILASSYIDELYVASKK